MSKPRPECPVGAAQPADWPRLAEVPGSLRHDLALKEASGEPAGRGLSQLVFGIDRAVRLRHPRPRYALVQRHHRAARGALPQPRDAVAVQAATETLSVLDHRLRRES
eukprot:scaffold8850_cov72-Phaeocystis_antarctica.AAC.5